jgi:cytochrome c biogenesis protein CcmG/thiol:disulfide interchange protein DsbE
VTMMIGRTAGAIGMIGVLVVSGCATQDGSAPAGSALPTVETTVPAPGTSDGASKELITAANLSDCPVTGPASPEQSQTSPVANGLPDLTLSCLGQGPDVNLAALRGKPYVVNVWASWCGPCRAELPLMGEVYRANRDQVGFLGIDMADDQIAALGMAAQTKMSFPSVQDPESKIRAGLAVAGVPTTVFMRADGSIAGRTNIVTSKEELTALIEQYLQVDVQ